MRTAAPPLPAAPPLGDVLRELMARYRPQDLEPPPDLAALGGTFLAARDEAAAAGADHAAAVAAAREATSAWERAREVLAADRRAVGLGTPTLTPESHAAARAEALAAEGRRLEANRARAAAGRRRAAAEAALAAAEGALAGALHASGKPLVRLGDALLVDRTPAPARPEGKVLVCLPNAMRLQPRPIEPPTPRVEVIPLPDAALAPGPTG